MCERESTVTNAWVYSSKNERTNEPCFIALQLHPTQLYTAVLLPTTTTTTTTIRYMGFSSSRRLRVAERPSHTQKGDRHG